MSMYNIVYDYCDNIVRWYWIKSHLLDFRKAKTLSHPCWQINVKKKDLGISRVALRSLVQPLVARCRHKTKTACLSTMWCHRNMLRMSHARMTPPKCLKPAVFIIKKKNWKHISTVEIQLFLQNQLNFNLLSTMHKLQKLCCSSILIC